MEPQASLEQEWPYLLSLLPPEELLEDTARAWEAIQRKRAVSSASDLLRLALVYGFCGYSLRQTAAWAEAAEVASLSDVALMNRLRKASSWLGHLLGIKLAERVSPLGATESRLRLIDATGLSAPGSRGTDWRVHLDFDLAARAIAEIQLTQVHGGETLLRYAFEPGEIVVADRGYSHRPGLAHVVAAQAHFIVRWNPSSTPLQWPGGGELDLMATLRSLPEAQPQAFELEIQPNPRQNIPAIPVRLIALRKSEDAAEAARMKALKKASRRGKKLQLQTLELAGYFLVLTSTKGQDASPEEILETYRVRWQVELVFKRLKSLLNLDTLPAKDPELARAFLYSKLLAAILLDELTHAYLSFSPWGYQLRAGSSSVALAYPPGPLDRLAQHGPRGSPPFHLDR